MYFLCVTTSTLFAQRAIQEIVYLKNGSIIRGDIIEQIPNESLKIQTADGNIFFYKIEEVAKITKEVTPQNRSQQKHSQNEVYDITPCYLGFVDFGYTIKTGKYGEDRLEFLTSHGNQQNPYFYLGVGTGIHYFIDSEVIVLPLFCDIRGTIIPMHTVSPVFGLKMGYSFNTKDDFRGGLYLAPSLGIRFLASGKTAMNFSIGYSAQRLNYVSTYNHYYDYNRYYESSSVSKQNISGFSIKFGIEL